jgi:hypothetical protein
MAGSFRRNVVWIIAATGFMAMASGLTLQLHLATAENSHHHDSTHCSLCQTMLGGGTKFHLESQSAVTFAADFVAFIPDTGVVPPRRLTPVVLSPRPPPTCAA